MPTALLSYHTHLFVILVISSLPTQNIIEPNFLYFNVLKSSNNHLYMSLFYVFLPEHSEVCQLVKWLLHLGFGDFIYKIINLLK